MIATACDQTLTPSISKGFKYNLLDEPLIGVTLNGEIRRGSLPEVLAWLSGDDTIIFTALRPHQQHPWHAFLVQLAAICLSQCWLDQFPKDPLVWRAMLLELSKGKVEPWCLIVEDLSLPALLQPPIPEGTIDAFKVVSTPDALDILLTSRNFDLKVQCMAQPMPEHWIYALVTKQTFEGYTGKMNYGVIRMNGGMSNRPCLGISPSLSWAPRFRRDVQVWMDQRKVLVDRYTEDGPALIWLIPWDGTVSLPRNSIHPFFIEICRRIRFTQGMKVWMGNSKVARIDTTDHAGDTGDIWTPTQMSAKKVNASLTLPAQGFTYKRLSELLFGTEWNPTPAMMIREEDGVSPVVIAQALVRGQGKTEGYHSRVIPIPAKVGKIFTKPQGKELLGLRSKTMIERVGEVRTLLKVAILTLFQGNQDKLDLRDDRSNPWIERFEGQVDDLFFDNLFETVDQEDKEARLAWDQCMDTLSRRVLQQALAEVPLPTMQRYPLLAAAEGRFAGGRRKLFGELLDKNVEPPKALT